MSWLSDKVNRFLNKDSIMATGDGTTQNTNAAISAATTTASSATAATTTYNAVYNADGTTTYYYSGAPGYTVNSAGYISSTSIGTTTVGGGGSGGATYTNWSYSPPTYQASIDYTGGKVTAKTFELNGADVGDLLDKICDRLAIIESADPEQLEKYKALNEAYQRYKFLENLLVDKGDKPL